MWSFATDPEYQKKLDWAAEFVERQIAPVDAVLGHPADVRDPLRREVIPPLQAAVREQGLWACHLGPALGGPGYGQLELGLLNEILGTSRCAPTIFGCQAPDSGNSELLALFATDAQKERYLAPLIDGQIMSCFSMTEPHGGADPTGITTCAVRHGNGWVLNGEKWFASNARYADLIIIVAVSEPDAPAHQRSSMFLVPRDTPGLEIVRNVASAGQPAGDGSHGYLRLTDVRLGDEQLLGTRGEAFAMAQARLGGGRIHHAMRTIGAARKAFDMMCERALSRTTRGTRLSDLQLVQQAIAESWLDLEQFRLLVLRTAWLIDEKGDYRALRKDISAVKAAMPRVLHDIAARALQIHGSLGVTDEVPFARLVMESFQMGLADGPTEVHQITLARQVLSGYSGSDALFPDYHLPTVRTRAEQRFADLLDGRIEEAWV
ncbi:acyl-CoA dehydrogenase family protein [Nocardia fusca]|uniref:acyl-CoA dehydrogenase family protein n=1 Tax=Nocardia fusca TaxID=941183 RepID=UPI000A6BB1DF|nr:acyl-CoA dehydrogenase family protein [Nocardia fusca]